MKINKIAIVMVAAMTITLCGCGNTANEQQTKSDSTDWQEKKQLVNHMTQPELESVSVGPLELLNEPWEQYQKDITRHPSEEYHDGVFLEIWSLEDNIRYIRENKEMDENYKKQCLDVLESYGNEYHSIEGAIVDGRYYSKELMPIYGYDGKKGTLLEPATDGLREKEYQDFEECKRLISDILPLYQNMDYCTISYSTNDVNQQYRDLVKLYDAVIQNAYQTLPVGTIGQVGDAYWKDYSGWKDYSWDYDRELAKELQAEVKEYHLYDEELNRKFVVQVMTPPGYDENKEYPAFVLTDGVWHFNDMAAMYKKMNEGTATSYLMVNIGYDYCVCGSDNAERSRELCVRQEEFLDFITDNLLPRLAEDYHISCSESVLFGHSQGGVFTHYAAFHSDQYENQPFGCYIIGSPTFWTSYFTQTENAKKYNTEYGYFERNKAFNKKILLTGGTLEDEDFVEFYNGNETTLEGLAHLKERLEKNGVADCEITYYESHHSEYVGKMLLDAISKK